MLRTALIAAAVAASQAAYTVQLDPWGDDSVRVRVSAPGNDIQDPPLMALLPDPPTSKRGLQPNLVHTTSGQSLNNGNLQVSVDATTGFVTATRVSDGAVLLQTQALVFAAPSSPGTRTGSASALISFQGAAAGEAVYGLGEHRTGVINQLAATGSYFKLFEESQVYSISHGGDVSIPWYASSRGYGFLWNNPAYGYVNLTSSQFTWYANATMGIDLWITTLPASGVPAGSSPYAPLLHNYVDAVGHAPTMPYYATGFIQCKDRYRNQTQLLEVARGYFERGLPISTIVIDWQHWVSQGDYSFNPQCWPDPAGMTAELQTMGIEPMVTFWPFQTLGSKHWDQFNNSGWLVPKLDGTLAPFDGNQYLYDATNPDARAAAFADFMDGYGQYGFKTVWLDASEPERPDTSTMGQWRFKAGTDAEIGEAWILQHVQIFSDGFAQQGITGADYFVLPRHAWAGTWRYSAALWSGDIASTFEELALQVRAVQGVVMSGVVLWTTDIGGYWDGDVTDPVFRELIVRWFQFGAFCPLFRLHGHRAGGPPSNECGPTNGDNEVWNLAPEQDNYNGIVAVMHLRENLREYVSQINAEAAATGMPMLRPMFLQWPDDAYVQANSEALSDQFMFGPNWLVAPVLTYNATNRTVYLPNIGPNSTWVYFYDETEYGSGGNTVTMATPIDEFPVFYRRAVPQPAYGTAVTFYSSQRNDTVMCVTAGCFSDNAPGQPGNYTTLQNEATVILSDEIPVTINGTVYPVVPLNLFFSFTHNDNFVATNTSAPDSSYTVTFNNGYVLSQQAPGSIPLQVWFKQFASDNWDFATVASAAGLQFVQAQGYTYKFTTGYVMPPPASVQSA